MKKYFLYVSLLLASSAYGTHYHLELAAANYGQEGHTQKALHFTYGGNGIAITSTNKGWFKTLEVSADPSEPISERHIFFQYKVLFDTLDKLVEDHPNEQIVFHVNDIHPSWAVFAAQQLMKYTIEKEYAGIFIEAIGGDFAQISAEKTLAPYGETAYDTVHLKNPEAIFAESMDGEDAFYTEESSDRGRAKLKKLANLSKHGLDYFVVDDNFYFPYSERCKAMQGIFYHNTSSWAPVPFYAPRGEGMIPPKFNRVFFINRD